MANAAVVYDRSVAGRELSFEASGALKQATLVLRDRETDSWWSIMTANAIGGGLAGTRLAELPVGEKTTWGRWRARYPDSLVLSVDGVEHQPRDGYASYWTSQRTFGDLEIDDDRLPAKTPIYAFTVGGQAFAIAHQTFENGRAFRLAPEDPRHVYLHRPAGSSPRASSHAFWLAADQLPPAPGAEGLDRLRLGGAPALGGFDTYWYSWAAIHPETRLLTGEAAIP